MYIVPEGKLHLLPFDALVSVERTSSHASFRPCRQQTSSSCFGPGLSESALNSRCWPSGVFRATTTFAARPPTIGVARATETRGLLHVNHSSNWPVLACPPMPGTT